MGTRVASCAGMGRSAALPSRRTAAVPTRVAARPHRVALRVVHPPRRHRVRATPPLFVAIEWFLLTMLGAVALALVTG